MSVTIVRNPGQGDALFFPSGPISFSQLRSYFKESGSGTVSASELRRNTNTAEANPVVPDATHNEQISTGSNLSLSQFRNSVKKYRAIQSGTNDNSHGRQEPGFRMGLYDPYGNGLDFAGGGVNGRDGQGGNNTGNHTKNIQKEVQITGTCGSVQVDQPAAQISPVVTVHNFRIEVFGSILGYGGKGGGTSGAPSISGENGGTALNLGNIGYNNIVIVRSGSRIYGGGGGGEKGKTGATGANGTCAYVQYFQGGCDCPGCPGGWQDLGCGQNYGNHCGRRAVRGCWGDQWWESNGDTRYNNCKYTYARNGGIGGLGGNGGPGRGYNNQSGSLNGVTGLKGGLAETCTLGGSYETVPQNGEDGENGGTGGEWANSGGNTSNTGNGGAAGRAISGTNSVLITGTTNSDTIKGSFN